MCNIASTLASLPTPPLCLHLRPPLPYWAHAGWFYPPYPLLLVCVLRDRLAPPEQGVGAKEATGAKGAMRESEEPRGLC